MSECFQKNPKTLKVSNSRKTGQPLVCSGIDTLLHASEQTSMKKIPSLYALKRDCTSRSSPRLLTVHQNLGTETEYIPFQATAFSVLLVQSIKWPYLWFYCLNLHCQRVFW